MIKNKKKLIPEDLPGFEASIEAIPDDSRIFVDKSMEIADYIFHIMQAKDMKQKDLALALGKTEAEISKWLAGMHNYTLRSLAKLEAALGETIICIAKKYSTISLNYTHNYQPDQINNVSVTKLKVQMAEYSKNEPAIVIHIKNKVSVSKMEAKAS